MRRLGSPLKILYVGVLCLEIKGEEAPPLPEKIGALKFLYWGPLKSLCGYSLCVFFPRPPNEFSPAKTYDIGLAKGIRANPDTLVFSPSWTSHGRSHETKILSDLSDFVRFFFLNLSEFWSGFVWFCLNLSDFVWICLNFGLNLSEFVWVCRKLQTSCELMMELGKQFFDPH